MDSGSTIELPKNLTDMLLSHDAAKGIFIGYLEGKDLLDKGMWHPVITLVCDAANVQNDQVALQSVQ